MPLTEALSLLLSDRALRAAFRSDARGLAERLGVHEGDHAAFVGLDSDALDVQAGGLLDKRLREVRGLLPQTFAGLGDAGDAAFLEFAESWWPQGHTRHQQDAVSFGEHLRGEGDPALSLRELNALRFALRKGTFAMHVVRDTWIAGRNRRALQVLWGKGRGLRETFLYLG